MYYVIYTLHYLRITSTQSFVYLSMLNRWTHVYLIVIIADKMIIIALCQGGRMASVMDASQLNVYEYCYCNYICIRELLSYVSYYLSCNLLLISVMFVFVINYTASICLQPPSSFSFKNRNEWKQRFHLPSRFTMENGQRQVNKLLYCMKTPWQKVMILLLMFTLETFPS